MSPLAAELLPPEEKLTTKLAEDEPMVSGSDPRVEAKAELCACRRLRRL